MKLRGFTLLELMIAILLFSMVSAAAYKLFTSVSRAQQVTDGILEKLDAIQRAEVVIEKDFFQMTPRPIRNEFGDKIAALKAPGTDGETLEFTRSGWRNPLDLARSNLQRVAYALEDGQLIRYYWPVLDRPQEPLQYRQVVLDKVRSFRVRFMNDKKQWKSSWPPSKSGLNPVQPGGGQNKQNLIPAAAEVTLVHEEFGSMLSVFPLSSVKSGQALAKKLGEYELGDTNKQRFEPELYREDGEDNE